MSEKKVSIEETLVYESCPHCGTEVVMQWDVEEEGYEIFCPACGFKMLLCDACKHSSDYEECDFDSDKCFRCENAKDLEGYSARNRDYHLFYLLGIRPEVPFHMVRTDGVEDLDYDGVYRIHGGTTQCLGVDGWCNSYDGIIQEVCTGKWKTRPAYEPEELKKIEKLTGGTA